MNETPCPVCRSGKSETAMAIPTQLKMEADNSLSQPLVVKWDYRSRKVRNAAALECLESTHVLSKMSCMRRQDDLNDARVFAAKNLAVDAKINLHLPQRDRLLCEISRMLRCGRFGKKDNRNRLSDFFHQHRLFSKDIRYGTSWQTG